MNDSARRIAAATAIATSIAIPAEGFRQFAYYDPPGILTVCMGHTGSNIDPRKKYSLSECSQYLTEDMQTAVAHVERCVPGLPENVLAAFSDAVFNMGPTIACNKSASHAARYLASHNYTNACLELPKWNKARVAGVLVPLPGLTKRRQTEMQLCLEG
jgi:lysozyme